MGVSAALGDSSGSEYDDDEDSDGSDGGIVDLEDLGSVMRKGRDEALVHAVLYHVFVLPQPSPQREWHSSVEFVALRLRCI